MAPLDRRDFLGIMAAAGAVPFTAQLDRRRSNAPDATVKAPDGRPLTAGLVGCGGRGTGAAANFLDSGPNLRITALADVFEDRLARARKILANRGQDIPESRCFSGFDAYQKLIDSGVDIVLLATPPHFRPAHFAAAVAAGKHTFLEKPVAVDGPGIRSVLETGRLAASKGLSVMTGTQLRRQRSRIETRKRILDGAIGDIVALRAIRNQGALWYRERQPGWSDMEYMIRDWVNWTWLSGDHIVEQHIHHLDSILWVTGVPPERALGMGARMRRPTGDQYDFFSIDYTFPKNVHLHSTIRQISGCTNERDESVVGTKGVADLSGRIVDLSGKEIWRYDGPEVDPLVQEHADLVTAIRTEKPINEVGGTAYASLIAIMGRDSAYTGKAVTWDEAMNSNERLGPTEYTMGPVPLKPEAPIPGTDSAPSSAN
ncbi:MAG TPA: Gfo/Idh/MocA family oxidoreductase [Vicinamibacterales bacterium]